MADKSELATVQLPSSLRKYIRKRKREIRDQFGEGSEQERELLAWVEEKKRQKLEKIRQGEGS